MDIMNRFSLTGRLTAAVPLVQVVSFACNGKSYSRTGRPALLDI
jgi:hypothetical protein